MEIKRFYTILDDILHTMAASHGLKESDLQKYYQAEKRFDIHDPNVQMSSINERLVYSIQNRNMMPSVINYGGRREAMSQAWFDFSPYEIAANFHDEKQLYAELRKHCSDLKETPSRLWDVFCKGVLSAAQFFAQFEDINQLRHVFDLFQENPWTKVALPTMLAKEVSGIQFALSCDFLKEIGYDYPKPDVHIMDVMTTLEGTQLDELTVMQKVMSYAKQLDMTAYKFDKMMWLVCSGSFYLDGKNSKRQKEELLDAIK